MKAQTERLLEYHLDVMTEALALVRGRLERGDGGEVVAQKVGDVTRGIDLAVEDLFLDRAERARLPIQLVSEERGVVDLVADPAFVVLLDPVDGTDMAVRGYPLCAIAVSVHRADTMETVAAVIGDIATGDVYFASPVGAFVRRGRGRGRGRDRGRDRGRGQGPGRGETTRPLRPAATERLDRAMVVSYAAKPARLLALAEQRRLLGGVMLLLNYGGLLDIARVGSGAADAFVEFAKGFPALEFAAGVYIAERAGAIATDLDGAPLVVSRDPRVRQTFAVSCTRRLHDALLASVDRRP